MLSHRSESKSEEPSVYPVDNTAPLRQKAEQPKAPTAVIGPKIRFKGELVGEEDLLVQGQVEGTIDLKGHHLTVGERGVLQANVTAKTVTVEGKVEGDLYGEERIAIRSSSHVQGNIKAERVVLEDGAKFRGSIDMDMDERSDVKAMASQLKESDAMREKSSKKPDEEPQTLLNIVVLSRPVTGWPTIYEKQ
eukprot:TRINITY_DN9005_c0_g2_i3.p1 TRINITY_DN9005_c0_g2~~TRINITY_DN9005_c0_g2_i3.p1  ORF type:complete len:192 (-),score=27.19 TRINITY_DN9005_c0_g2_i3:108-683(-)